MSSTRASKPSLTVHLMGGLGNQLFQYAFGRRLAMANGAELYLDASGYPSRVESDPAKGLRTCQLSEFNIVGSIFERPVSSPTRRRSSARIWRRVLRTLDLVADKRKPYYARREIVEPPENHFLFDSRVLARTIRGAVSIRGYWQSEKYFAQIEPELRQEITLRHALDSANQRLATLIMSTTAVGVHIRHGDNASAVAPSLGVLPAEYYAKTLMAVKKEVRDARFFVFSDDVSWAKEFLGDMVDVCYVEHNSPAKSHADLWLMSLCRHHVLANSTFGWWAAWLGRTAEQIVFAPRRYYQNVDRPNPDLYPLDWRLI